MNHYLEETIILYNQVYLYKALTDLFHIHSYNLQLQNDIHQNKLDSPYHNLGLLAYEEFQILNSYLFVAHSFLILLYDQDIAYTSIQIGSSLIIQYPCNVSKVQKLLKHY